MGKKKYIKNSKGVTMSVTTDTLGLEKPLLNENYDIDVHNRNMDKIDEDLKPIDDSYIIELFQHDGDTTNPRDYYTKAEADGKFASKEDLINIDLSNLATKEEANNALNKANEAFQRGDNVKTQLVDKLISEGLDVSTNNTFEELIGGIALGKKWASGKSTGSNSKSNFSYSPNGDLQPFYYTDISINFVPSVIIAFGNNTTHEYITLFNKEGNLFSKSNVKVSAYQGGVVSGGNHNFKADEKIILNNNTYRLPLIVGNLSVTWIAYE